MDKLLSNDSFQTTTEEFCLEKQMRDERQEEKIEKLQATVEAQGKILQAMANVLKIEVKDE